MRTMTSRWRRVLTFLGLPGHRFDYSPMPIDQAVRLMWNRYGTVNVNRAEALSVPAVRRGRNEICAVATLPLVQRNAAFVQVASPFLAQIDPNVPNVVTLSQTFEDLIFEGIGWWQITQKLADGFPLYARRLDPATVSLDPPKDRPAPLPSGWDPRDVPVYVEGKIVPSTSVIRFDSPNPGLLPGGGARAVKRALLLDALAAMYAEDPRPMDYFTPADGIDPADVGAISDILTDWREARRLRTTGYVPAALKYNVVDAPSPADLQLAELQKAASLDVANLIGVDPEDVGVPQTSRTYANITDRRTDKINRLLGPYMAAITQRLSMGDVTPRGNAVEFDLAGYLRPDPVTLWNVYETQQRMGVTDVEEIRERERWPARPSLSEPVSAVPSGSEADAEAAELARRVAGWTFAGPARHTFDVPLQTFAVDVEARTIEGVIVPWNRSAKGFRFERGSLKWSDPGRVKLLRDHDPRTAFGKAIKLTDKPDGLHGKFVVSAGPAGDEALQLADDGVLDGFSIGVDFDISVDTVPDPKNKQGLLARRADLRETSLTALPSFDDARVSGVKMSEGATMDPCTECGHIHAAGTPHLVEAGQAPGAAPATATPAAAPANPGGFAAPAAGQTFTAEQLGPMIAAAIAQLNTAGPARVDPSHATPRTFDAPAPAYRFDARGNLIRGEHDFGRDFIVAIRDGDAEAHGRVMTFMREQLDPGRVPTGIESLDAARRRFDVQTGDVNELNPTRNRPELFVDQRSFRYPIWDSIFKGTLTDITPFVFPKFTSASGLVAAHTEGVEPTTGTYVVEGQTVTPGALSGKVSITRETWDQGGNPQVGNLIWQQIVKAWYEALEAAAVTMLNAASPTSLGSFTAGGGTTGQTLAAELKRYLAALHFVRGGFTMTDAATQVDLYQALNGAQDDTGRPLFPAIGPSNADGTVSNRFQSINVNGVDFLPAWALAATGSVAASSYLYDRSAVHGWATAPQRLTLDQVEVRYVHIGVWGYQASAISDITGVRELIFDPVA
jgi:HK97 family phage prohead protease